MSDPQHKIGPVVFGRSHTIGGATVHDRWWIRFGWKLQAKVHVMRHTSHLPDRLVIQPSIVFDRKRHRTLLPERWPR